MLAGKIYNVSSSSSSSSSAVEQFAQLMWIASILLFGTLGWWQQQTVVVSAAAAATNISAGDKISATEMGGKRHQFCCYVRDIFTFNPFNTLRMQRGRIRFAALRLSDVDVDNDEALEQQRQRQSMSKFLKINLQGNTVNVTFFPSIMAYLKDDSDYYKNKRRKQSGVSTLSSEKEKQFDSYFGTDIEMLKELAHRMNFTARMIIPGDGQYYGFRVRR